jgi:hypothetical protein
VTPPERLRGELERLRSRGLSFKRAWPVAVSRALRDESMTSTLFWGQAWAEQRHVWRLNYSRTKWVATPEPLFVPDHEADPAHQLGTIVA